MDKIKQYQTFIKEILTENAPIPHDGYDEFEAQVVMDYENQHFYLMRVGWKEFDRTHNCVIHLDIKTDGKIWVQQDNTEYGVANELVDKGVPKDEIVLAFQAPYRRIYSDFAVA
jgi:hypothetical protein